MKNFFKSNKSILSKIDKKSIVLGIKKGYNIPLLPANIEIIYSNIYSRILRFIGGFCLLLALTKFYLFLPTFSHKIIIILGAIQSVQIILILNIENFRVYSSKLLFNESIKNRSIKHTQ